MHRYGCRASAVLYSGGINNNFVLLIFAATEANDDQGLVVFPIGYIA